MIREKWNDFMLDTKNINRLMTDKVEDYILLEEQPLPIRVGTKTIYIGNFNFKNENKFFQQWATILSNMSARIINMELADERKKELFEACSFDLLSNGKYMLEFLWMDKWLYKQLCKLIKNTILKQKQYKVIENKLKVKKLRNCSYRYFKNNIKKETLIRMCWLIYLYNFDSQKKSLKMVVEKMNIKQLQETYIPFWLQNLGGLTGKFHTAPVPNGDWLSNDDLSSPNIPQEQNNG